MGCSRNWLSGNNCFGVLWTIFVEKFEQHSNADLRWIIIVVKYFHIKFLDEISRMMIRAIERETNGKIWKIIFERSFEWSSEHWIDGNIRATENLLRIISYEKWLNRSIMRYRRTPTSISPWWFVKSSRSSLRFIFANISCSSNHYFLISDYHWISNWIFTLTNSILPSKNIIPIKNFPINSYAKINIFNP